jgi:uncharacterized protein YqiB (DUF1249 family)
MWVYEKNFRFLKKIIPLYLDNANNKHLLHYGTGHFEFSIAEECKYTLELDIKQILDVSDFLANGVAFRVRVYMDAEVAEVVSYLGQSRLLPRYDYPNINMWQPDEKKQANLLLHDCLLHLIGQGIENQCVEVD